MAVDAGDLDEAKFFLESFIQAGSSTVMGAQDLLLDAAAAEAGLGCIAMAQSRYHDAAEHFRLAGGWIPQKEIDRRREYRRAEADSYYRQGQEQGDDDALRLAVNLSKPLLRETWYARTLPQWTILQSKLGDALQKLGERDGCIALLEGAAAAYRALLDVVTRQSAPREWAITQSNLGFTLLLLGERQNSAVQLEKAATAYRAALEELSVEGNPSSWARAQGNLANALAELGRRETRTMRVEEAVAAYRAILNVLPRESAPLEWAMTQNNLGLALLLLGERQSSAAQLKEALAAFRAALEERTRERVPSDWTVTQTNLGDVLLSISVHEDSMARLKEAMTAYRDALGVFEAADAGHHSERIRHSLAKAEWLLAERISKGKDRASLFRTPMMMLSRLRRVLSKGEARSARTRSTASILP